MTERIDRQVFLENRDDTGRFIVKYLETGKEYYVEPINNESHRTDWGSYNPGTGKVETKKGHAKHEGGVKPSESLITKENGFEDIHMLQVGESPLGYIDMLHEQYKQEMGLA